MRVFKNQAKPSLTCVRQCGNWRAGAHFEGREEKVTKMALAEQFEGVICHHTRVVRLVSATAVVPGSSQALALQDISFTFAAKNMGGPTKIYSTHSMVYKGHHEILTMPVS